MITVNAQTADASDISTCESCGGLLGFQHDHKPDNTGLDDGPHLPHRGPRKKVEPKPPEVMADIRARAWASRRAKYGAHGHG